MKYYILSINEIKIYFSIILILISSGSIFYSYNSTIINILILVFLPFIISKNNNLKPLLFVFCFLFFLFLANLYSVDVITCLTLYLHFLLIFFTSKKLKSLNAFQIIYINVLTPLLLLSIVGFVLNLIIPELFTDFFFFSSFEDASYKNFLFFYTLNDPINNFRNIGIFWEPGVYAFFISLYLYSLYSLKKRVKNPYLLIILGYLTLISTFSSTSFFIIIFLILKFHSSYNLIKAIKFLSLVLFLLALYFFTYSTEIFNNFIFESSISSKARLYDIYLAIELIFQKPFFGWGYSSSVFGLGEDTQFLVYNDSILETIGLEYIHERGITNGLFLLFGYFGIVGGFFFIKIFINPLGNLFSKTLLIFLFFFNFTQPIFFMPISLILYFLNNKHQIIKYA